MKFLKIIFLVPLLTIFILSIRAIFILILMIGKIFQYIGSLIVGVCGIVVLLTLFEDMDMATKIGGYVSIVLIIMVFLILCAVVQFVETYGNVVIEKLQSTRDRLFV